MKLVLATGVADAVDPGSGTARPPSGQVVPGRYIVVLREDVPSAGAVARDLALRHGLAVSHVYETALKGFAADVPAGRLLALQLDPRVAYVEPDQIAYALAQTIPTGVQRIFATSNANLDIDGVDDYRVDVDVAVIDTGIADHPDLHVVARANCASGWFFSLGCAEGGTDGNGHGTHVAGTIAALDNGIGVVGVAPGARLWSVKVLSDNGSGYISWIVAGIDWVTANANQIEVANMSLGCECSSSALDTAISNSVEAGIVYGVAAGNGGKDAATFSPANHPDVITVSALADFNGLAGGGAASTCRDDQDDTLADFSNWGSKVEVAAPGVCILSTWNDGGYWTISGTSMASPHVAGAAALLASGPNKPTSRAAVMTIRTTIIERGNDDWTDDSGDAIKEPLLDVSDLTVFAPSMTAGSGDDTTGSTPESPPASTDAMGVFSISWSSSKHLDVKVAVRHDADGSGALTAGDAPVSGATVLFELIRDRNKDGGFTCGDPDECWIFVGQTNSSGEFRGKLLHAPSGDYRAAVRSLSHGTYSWDPTLDEDNPDFVTK